MRNIKWAAAAMLPPTVPVLHRDAAFSAPPHDRAGVAPSA